jgi:hypothetical protein
MSKGEKSWSREGLEEREVVSTTNPIYSHWSFFSATNRHSVFGLSTKREQWTKILSPMNSTGKTNRQQETDLRNTLITLSHTNGVVRLLIWDKYKVRTKESTREWRRGPKENTPSSRQFLSSTLKNGLTAEHFSVCWMRRAELTSHNRQNLRNAYIYRSLRIQTLHRCMTYRKFRLVKVYRSSEIQR